MRLRTVAVRIGIALAAGGAFLAGQLERMTTAAPPPRMEGAYWTYALFDECEYYLVQPMGPNAGQVKSVPSYQPGYEYRVDYGGGRATLMQRLTPGGKPAGYFPRFHGAGKEWEPLFEFAPSLRTPGDWDLIAVHERAWTRTNENSPLARRELPEPIPSFFHRLQDERAKEYAELAAWRPASRDFADGGWAPPPVSDNHAERRLELALGMTRDHPGDPGYGIFELDALVAKGDASRLEEAVERWRPQFANATAGEALGFRKAEHSVRSFQLTAEGRNLDAYLRTLLGGNDEWRAAGPGLSERIDRAPEVWKYTGYAQRYLPLSGGLGVSFLVITTDARLKELLCLFLLFRGERDRAMDLILSTYHAGQLYSRGDDNPLGMALNMIVRQIAIGSMEVCLLNGGETPQEMPETWKRLEALNANEPSPSLLRDGRQETLGLLYPAYLARDWEKIDLAWGEMRFNDIGAQFQLLRMAVAARFHQQAFGTLPAVAADFGPWLSALPLDPFTSAPLHFIASPEVCTVYSTGPDKIDDRAAIAYDPTNGMISSGDIFTRVPLKREFPFPKGGVKAYNRANLLEQFPNGLPTDPFSGWERPLNASPTYPVYIFSWGPDGDGWDGMRTDGKRREVPEVSYDPTNGLTSDGDLYLRLPMQ